MIDELFAPLKPSDVHDALAYAYGISTKSRPIWPRMTKPPSKRASRPASHSPGIHAGVGHGSLFVRGPFAGLLAVAA